MNRSESSSILNLLQIWLRSWNITSFVTLMISRYLATVFGILVLKSSTVPVLNMAPLSSNTVDTHLKWSQHLERHIFKIRDPLPADAIILQVTIYTYNVTDYFFMTNHCCSWIRIQEFQSNVDPSGSGFELLWNWNIPVGTFRFYSIICLRYVKDTESQICTVPY